MSLSQARWLQPDFPFRPSKCPLFYGWVIVGASVMGMMSSIPGQTAGVGPFTDHLLENLQLSRLELSAAYLVGTALSGFILPKMGSLFDAYGARLTGTVVKVAFGLSLCYMASTAWLYRMFKPSEAPLPWLALGLVTAGFFLIRFLGQGVTAMISRAMLGKWFNRKRGIASAIGGCATSLAFSGGPLVLFALVEVIGWREAWLALGLLLIGVVSVLTWLTYRDNPEECGLEMDGDPALQKAAETTDPEFVVHREYTGPEAIRTYSFWIFTSAFGLAGVLATAVSFHALDIARELEVSSTFFFSLYLYTAAISIPGGFLIGWLTGKLRLKILLGFMAICLATAALGLLFLQSKPGIAAYVGGVGMTGACFGTLMAVCYPRFFGRKHLGAVSGWSMFVLVLSSAIAPLLWSISNDLFASYAPANWAFVGCCALLFVAAFFADNPQRSLDRA